MAAGSTNPWVTAHSPPTIEKTAVMSGKKIAVHTTHVKKKKVIT